MGVWDSIIISGHSVCCAWVLWCGTSCTELAFMGKVGAALVGLPRCPCLVGTGKGFPVVGGAGEIIGG